MIVSSVLSSISIPLFLLRRLSSRRVRTYRIDFISIYKNEMWTNNDYFRVREKTGLSPIQGLVSYLGGSLVQTILDNPLTSYRQLVQQYAKDANGHVDPIIARQQANKVFMRSPLSASMSGVTPRLVGVFGKRIPKFTSLLAIAYMLDTDKGEVGYGAAVAASVISAPFINPLRMIEKQQRAKLRETGRSVSVKTILSESSKQNFAPLFRGTSLLVAHSMASAVLGLAGQPKLKRYIEAKLDQQATELPRFAVNLLSSSVITPIYVFVTNPISRLEVIVQASDIRGDRVRVSSALRELAMDSKAFGLRGLLRGNGLGIVKGIVSLSLFHEGRLAFEDGFRYWNM